MRFPPLVRAALLGGFVCHSFLCSAQGIITTVAGNGGRTFSGDGGPATSASLRGPDGVVVDAAGNLYIADTANCRIRKVNPGGLITTIAGNGLCIWSGDGGPATAAGLPYPQGIAMDSAGNLYVAQGLFASHHCVRKIAPAGTISTIAGTGPPGFSGDGGPATEAQLSYPRGLAVDAEGSLFIADIENHRIRRVSATGTITTVVGSGEGGYSGDGGPATAAKLYRPGAVAVDRLGNLYISESFVYTYDAFIPYGNHRIRKVTSDGIITTVAGTGVDGFSGDGGPATQARLCFPQGVFVDSIGNLYVTDSGNQRIRKVDLAGTITTVAGLGPNSEGEGGFSGDGGPATSAGLNLSTKDYTKSFGATVVDAAGNLFIADTNNGRIRKVTSTSAPFLPGGSVVNAASFSPAEVAPGSLVSFFGSFLAGSTQSAQSAPLPRQLGESGVAIGGLAAPLLYVSPSQINAQIPFEVPPGEVAVQVRTNLGAAAAKLTVTAASPGIFVITSSTSSRQGVILTPTGEVAAAGGSIPGVASRPARRGEFISIYATGLGDVSNRPSSGALALSQPLSETSLKPTVRVGGVSVIPSFSGLAPGYVGLYQVNARVPAEAPGGNAVTLEIIVGGVTSNTVVMAVQEIGSQ